MKRITLIIALVIAVSGSAAGTAAAEDEPDPGAASASVLGEFMPPKSTPDPLEGGLLTPTNDAFGCWFNASNPYVSGGRIWTKLQVRCSTGRYLYWHARLTKDVTGLDKTVGSSDGFDYFPAGTYVTWYLSNNRDSCPGSGSFFGKLSIQTSSLGTAYSDRSANIGISIC